MSFSVAGRGCLRIFKGLLFVTLILFWYNPITIASYNNRIIIVNNWIIGQINIKLITFKAKLAASFTQN